MSDLGASRPLKFKFDLHVHTANSKDAFTPFSDLPTLCRYRGLDGVAITDHNYLSSRLIDGTIALPGIEISSADGHVIGLGLTTSVRRGLSADETILEIHSQGGIAIIPHPHDLFRSSVDPGRLKTRPDAIEVFNASSMIHSITWRRALASAKRVSLPMVAGSDSHIPQTLGAAYTIVDSPTPDPSAVISSIKNGSVTAVPGTVSASQRLRKLLLKSRDRR